MSSPRMVPPEEAARYRDRRALWPDNQDRFERDLAHTAAVLGEQREAVLARHWRDEAPKSDGGMGGFCAYCSALQNDYAEWPCDTARDILYGESGAYLPESDRG